MADTERQMARLDMVFAEQTGRAIEAVDLLVMGAGEFVQSPVPPAEDMAAVLRRRINGVRQLAAVLVVDAAGQNIVSTDTDPASIPASMVELLLAGYRADPQAGLLIGRPFRVGESRWNTLLSRPIRSPNGKLAGMAVGSINLSYFEDFYRAVELNENGAIVLHLRDGTVLARFPHVDKAIGTTFGHLPPFTEVLAKAQAGTLLMESPVDGSIRVTAIRALRAFPLAVMISVEQGRVLIGWQHEAMALSAVALLLGGVVVVLLLSLSRRSSQIERLLEQSHTARADAEQAKDRLLQQIAERERAEGALRQAQRIEAIGQLTGGVAHDFNNLLTVVLGNVDILQRRAADAGNGLQSVRLAAIRAAAERGATLTGHLLAFARRQPLMPKAVDLNATIRGMQALLNSATGIRVRSDFRPFADLWPAMVDQSQIELVILNLVINARDAMPDGGVVTIETANCKRAYNSNPDGPAAGDYVAITVRDIGTGIPADILAHVFEPFFTTKPPGAGSGLGLSQVFGTARQSGGEVHIDTNVGYGTAVTVDLPRAVAGPTRSSGKRPSASSPRGTNVNILLVDDDDAVRAVTAAMLTDLGYHVRDVPSAEAALNALANDARVEILLTDLVMPGMNGSQLAAAVRARHPGLPVVYVSGYADQIGQTWKPDSPVIRKPFSASDLCRAIEDVVAEHRLVSGTVLPAS